MIIKITKLLIIMKILADLCLRFNVPLHHSNNYLTMIVLIIYIFENY